MKTGISTASLFLRQLNEDAVSTINSLGSQTTEVFLASFCEYDKNFAAQIKNRAKGMDIHSVHSLTTHFEPQLYSEHIRAKADAYAILHNFLEAGKIMGAKYYTFHGVARLKRRNSRIDIEKCAEKTNQIIETCKEYGITLAYENVHWAYYNYDGFYSDLKKYCKDLKGVLDIKQARQSGICYKKYLNDMAGDIVTVHISDFDSAGNMVLPGKGTFDFYELFCRLKDTGFDGAVLIEAYKDDYGGITELKTALEYINELCYRVF